MSYVTDPVYLAFVRHLVDLRLGRRVRQAELAARLGKPQSYVSKVERRERRLDVAEWAAWVSAIGADPALEFAAALETLAGSPEGG